MSERRLVSKAEYARHRSVSGAAVTYWARDGKIVIVHGRVDVDASDALLEQTNHPTHGGKRTQEPESGPVAVRGTNREEVMRTKARQTDLSADLLEQRLRKERGELVEKKSYDAALGDGLAPIVTRLRSLSTRVAPKLLGLNEVRQAQDVVDDEVEALCQEIADTLRAMIASAGATKQ